MLPNSEVSVFETIPGAVFSLNAQGKVLAMSPGCEELFGKPRSALVGKKGFSLVGGGALRRVFEEGEPTSTLVDLGGRPCVLTATSRTSEDGDVVEATFLATPIPKDLACLEKLDALDHVMGRIEFDLDGRILDVNEKFLEAVGYSRDEVVGKHHSMFAVPEVRGSDEYRAFWRGLGEGRPASGEFRRIGRGGKSVYLHALYQPLFDEKGKPKSVIKFALDITKSVQVRTDALNVKTAVEALMARIDFTMDGRILDANDNFLGVMGYAREEVVGKHHSMFAPPELRGSDEYRRFWETLNQGRPVSGEFKRVAAGNKTVYIKGFYCPNVDAEGKVVSVTKLAIDVTEAVETRIQAQRVRAVVDNSPNPTMLLDLKGMTITYANPVAIKTLTKVEKFLPIRAADIVGSSVDVFHKHPEHQRRLLADPKNLPHEARIQVGPETLQLQVYALFDGEGAYTGPALQWNIITERAAMEKRDAEAKRAVNVVREALARVADGDVDVRIADTFEGELDGMRENVNQIAEVLRNFNETMLSLSESARTGRLSERADASRFRGAYAEIVRGVNNIVDAIMTPVEDIRGKLGLVATGDLTAYVDAHYEGDHGELKNALNRSLDGLNELLGQISVASRQIGSSSSQVATAAQDLSQGASEQAATIEEISAQMGQITTQTQQNADNASQANQLAVAARNGARAGDARMNEMLGAMREIEEASNNISKIIKVIDEIAFQTNLLALNAAVEAARAGVHGKGFAVVAEEVRNLAARSARAAKETTEMIEGSIKKVALGTGIAKETATALGAIVQDVGKVSDLVAEIAAASNEQAEGINQINSGLDQVNLVTQRNTATAEESAASAQETSGQVNEMRSMVSRFRLRELRPEEGLPAGMTPEMMAVVQAYVERLLGSVPRAARSEGQATPPRSPEKSPKTGLQINLDTTDFGKY